MDPPPSNNSDVYTDNFDVGIAVGVIVALLVVSMVISTVTVVSIFLWRRYVCVNYVRVLIPVNQVFLWFFIVRSKKGGPSNSEATKNYVEDSPHLEVRLQPNPAYCSFHKAALQLQSPGEHGSPSYENVPMRVT